MRKARRPADTSVGQPGADREAVATGPGLVTLREMERREHARLMDLALGDLQRSGKPPRLSRFEARPGWRRYWYRWPDGKEVGPTVWFRYR